MDVDCVARSPLWNFNMIHKEKSLILLSPRPTIDNIATIIIFNNSIYVQTKKGPARIPTFPKKWGCDHGHYGHLVSGMKCIKFPGDQGISIWWVPPEKKQASSQTRNIKIYQVSSNNIYTSTYNLGTYIHTCDNIVTSCLSPSGHIMWLLYFRHRKVAETCFSNLAKLPHGTLEQQSTDAISWPQGLPQVAKSAKLSPSNSGIEFVMLAKQINMGVLHWDAYMLGIFKRIRRTWVENWSSPQCPQKTFGASF